MEKIKVVKASSVEQETDYLKKEVDKLKSLQQKQNKNCNDLEENIMMLENVLETRDLKIHELEEEIQKHEETSNINCVCDMCTKGINPQKELKDPSSSITSDENLPSTSKCGTCEYESDNENDVIKHKETNHECTNFDFSCDSCDFNAETEDDLEKHKQLNHGNFICEKCEMKLKTEVKLQTHTCKIHVKNPSYCFSIYEGVV